jgi:hypothetical protein
MTQPTAYELALALVRYLDTAIERRHAHLYTCDGRLITTLDQAVHALQTNNIAPMAHKGHPNGS